MQEMMPEESIMTQTSTSDLNEGQQQIASEKAQEDSALEPASSQDSEVQGEYDVIQPEKNPDAEERKEVELGFGGIDVDSVKGEGNEDLDKEEDQSWLIDHLSCKEASQSSHPITAEISEGIPESDILPVPESQSKNE